MALVLTTREYAAYRERLAKRFAPAVLRGVHSGAARAVGYLVQRTREAPPANPAGKGSGGAVNTGNFARQWKFIRLPDGAELRNDSSYAGIVDPEGRYGRRPGSKFPPKAELIAWIKRRLLATPRKPSRKRGGSRPTDAARAAADDIRRKKQALRDGKRFASYRKHGPAKPPGPSRRSANLDKQAERLYFPIARAIAKRGLLGRRILNHEDARKRILEMVQDEVVKELYRETNRR